MRKSIPAADADAYVSALSGWQRACVETLRASVRKVKGLDETVKWGHLVYAANGPVLLIRAEDQRVLFGFWRGQRLREIELRLKAGGKYEMATLEIRESTVIKPAVASRLAREAVALNARLGDPTKVVKVGTVKAGVAQKVSVTAKTRKMPRKKAAMGKAKNVR